MEKEEAGTKVVFLPFTQPLSNEEAAEKVELVFLSSFSALSVVITLLRITKKEVFQGPCCEAIAFVSSSQNRQNTHFF